MVSLTSSHCSTSCSSTPSLRPTSANDIIDTKNDEAKELKTIPVLYGERGTVYWILGFTLLHTVGAYLFTGVLGPIATSGVAAGLVLLVVANVLIFRGKTSEDWLKVLPMFHVTMLLYVVSMIVDYFI